MSIFMAGELWLLAVAVTLCLGLFAKRRKRRQAEARRAKKEADVRAREARIAENQRRSKERREYFKKNPPLLYFHTISGITAVVLPEDLARCKAETTKARLNGKWTHEKVLMPIENTHLVASATGAARIAAVFGRPQLDNIRVGWQSELDDLVEKHRVTLVPEDELFVPMVNESILPFPEHKVVDRYPSEIALVIPQAPAELRPV